MNNKVIRVAVVYHVFAHYREAVIRELLEQDALAIRYYFFSDIESRDGIELSSIGSDSGLRFGLGAECQWARVKNRWFGKYLLWQDGVVDVALDKKFDCIIFLGSMYYISTWLGAVIARARGKRVLMWTHGYLRDEPGLKGLLRKLFYRLADGFLLYGNRAKQIMKKKGFDENSIFVVYNSLDYRAQQDIRCSFNEAKATETRGKLFRNSQLGTLIFTGRLTKSKRVDLLLDALVELRLRGLLLNLIIVGDGPELESLREFVNRNGLESNVVFYGSCYEEKVLGGLIMTADISVSPGEVGLNAIHSMAFGTPVITHDDADRQGPEWEAVEHGLTGFFFERNSHLSLADAIFDYYSSGKAKRYYFDNCVSKVENYYSATAQVKVINEAVLGLKCFGI
jgi:glycosyltransferase involved in cell wall biosynthesis